jgi:adenylylsulfate kinase
MSATPSISMHRVSRAEKEQRLRQRGHVIWLYGLSGSGKSTLAIALERSLTTQGFLTTLLDGDEIRAGLNHGLGFSDADRTENLRRAAEVARLFARSGIVTICAFITPRHSQRDLITQIVAPDDLTLIHLSASFSACAGRDPKGLYARAAANKIPQFTGRDSAFEAPLPGPDALVVDTESEPPNASLARLLDIIEPRIRPAP